MDSDEKNDKIMKHFQTNDDKSVAARSLFMLLPCLGIPYTSADDDDDDDNLMLMMMMMMR